MSINWNLLPVFIHKGVIDFPFSNNTKAQEFMELLVLRSLFMLVFNPDNDCSMEEILRYLGMIREEYVSEPMGNNISFSFLKLGRLQVDNSWGNVI
jgi:hypothetical protein